MVANSRTQPHIDFSCNFALPVLHKVPRYANGMESFALVSVFRATQTIVPEDHVLVKLANLAQVGASQLMKSLPVED
jgi:hypothetical protein